MRLLFRNEKDQGRFEHKRNRFRIFYIDSNILYFAIPALPPREHGHAVDCLLVLVHGHEDVVKCGHVVVVVVVLVVLILLVFIVVAVGNIHHHLHQQHHTCVTSIKLNIF